MKQRWRVAKRRWRFPRSGELWGTTEDRRLWRWYQRQREKAHASGDWSIPDDAWIKMSHKLGRTIEAVRARVQTLRTVKRREGALR